MQLIKSFTTVFNVIIALTMAFFLWEGVKAKDKASIVGFGFIILLFAANTVLIWR